MAKIAFFIHDVGMYGATRSIALALNTILEEKLEDVKNIHLFYHGKRVNKSIAPSALFDRIPNKHNSWLPISQIYLGSIIDSYFLYVIKQIIRYIYCLMDWFFNYGRIYRKIKFDTVHINAHVMWPLLFLLKGNNTKLIIHIRDIFDFNRFPLISKYIIKVIIRRVDCIIAIDRLTAEPFLGFKNLIVLTNPFNMESVYILRQNIEVVFNKYKLPKTNKYISLIGQISNLKGASMFLELAKRMSKRSDIHFLLIGGNNSEYSSKVISQARSIDNITYLGETMEVEDIYSISDIVVRCDSFLPLGRTLWEAYYSGCKVLAPVRENDDIDEIKLLLNNSIWLYKANDINDMVRQLGKIIDIKISPPNLHGNYKQYAEDFYNILTS